MSSLTPMMNQYKKIKSNYKDCILFFRLGDFYEMFFEDALTASKELEITLTQRDCGQKEKAPMCGVPHHAVEPYIAKLIDKGYKVAICEQLEDPKFAKGIVKRDIVKIISPGTITDTNALDEKSNNFIASLYMNEEGVGLTYADISTGEVYTTECMGNEKDIYNFILDEIGKINPSEILVNELLYNNKKIMNFIRNRINAYIDKYDDGIIDEEDYIDKVQKHFNITVNEKNSLFNKNYSIRSMGVLLDYLYSTQKNSLDHLKNISYYEFNEYMILDINARTNLEIVETIRGREKKGSLLWILDKTSTAMGGRLLKKWLEQPLLSIRDINKRLDIIDIFVNDIIFMDKVKDSLSKIYDLERLSGKISNGNCNGRDLISLKISLENLPLIKDLLINSTYEPLITLGKEIDCLEDVYNLIDKSIIDDPPVSLKDGGIIKSSYNEELCELRNLSHNGKGWLSNLEESEKKKTGIRSLKVGFNKVFGYYIEVSNANLDLVPDNYIRKQTLSNAERFITPELKEMEAKILGAEDRMINLEYKLFVQIRDDIKKEMDRIQRVSRIISKLDVLNSLSQVSYKNNYVRPHINNEEKIEIKNGKHPIVEKMLENNDKFFVPNDTCLDEENKMLIITGPNMAGKSTYMRQVALITLMAQIGCFVPADSADIGIVDKIFTRIGASDNLSQGESTFMVEMNEVANIIKNATEKSLIILDEVGRGTSTFDGLSIAGAVVEYIAQHIKAKTLFATHYHELTQLEDKIDGVKNFTIMIQEEGDSIKFLRKIVRGSSDRSYGIEVAKLSGIDESIINRAKEILAEIEMKNSGITDDKKSSSETKIKKKNKNNQIDLFQIKKDKLIEEIKNINILKLTPMDAMNILYKLVENVKNL
ncbi:MULTISPECIES: DNA mismatch repair protein MutS [Tissierellales]|uniref:DNA mismatch repair protein MutS n=1 Tax=Acidilutibacter cellobiosedens TaxID=2507161 RepID=A0A410QCJ1_9FIRM|nr:MULTISPECIES: DNA mismatch repair protein MutS [Tissierellales]QAT61705.1 DNA mismatch repair protein MutS [Acidilutibacter cellobiosedens]SCL82655.1 DNA mismatch repair protein MutS [Sporanaerobacter sp. PP17-6a]